MWLSFGPAYSSDPDRNLLDCRSALVRGCNCAVADARELAADGVRVSVAGRKTAVLRSQGTACHSHRDLCPGRGIGLLDAVPQIHPHARPVRCLPLHGHLLNERISNVCPHDHHSDACEVPAGLHFPASSSDRPRPPLHRHSGHLFCLSLDRQSIQTDQHRFPTHGKQRLTKAFSADKLNLQLVVMIGVRKMLEFVFTQRELKILDDVWPEHKRKEIEDKKNEGEDGNKASQAAIAASGSSGNMAIPLANGNILKIALTADTGDQTINISEQLTKSSAWKTIDQKNSGNTKKAPTKPPSAGLVFHPEDARTGIGIH